LWWVTNSKAPAADGGAAGFASWAKAEFKRIMTRTKRAGHKDRPPLTIEAVGRA
jgi:hypothetical protein